MNRDTNTSLQLIWGCEGIAREIGRTRRQTFHLLESGAIPAAKKIGGRWVADRRHLRALFVPEAA